MKKQILLLGMLLTAAGTMAQTFVSTWPQKRNALIEEYTGVNCQYCPLGHKVVDEVTAMYPGRVFSINIHQGTFASRYTTQWGNALAQQAMVTGYPSTTINRHPFKGVTNIQVDPGECYVYVPKALAMDAPVNVAAIVDIDPETRLMTVTVEAYYTANSTADINLLNVAVLQNNVLGPQASGSLYYPENMVGGQYNHKHMLRHLITGQWGDTIAQTTEGSFFTKEYVAVVPHTIGDVDIPNLDDLSVLVFVCEGHKEVLNVTEAIRVGDRARLARAGAEQPDCRIDVQPFVTIVNPTSRPISDLGFSVDGTPMTAHKTISAYMSDTVNLAPYVVASMPAEHEHHSDTRTVEFTGYTTDGNSVSLSGEEATIEVADFDLYTTAGPLTLSIQYDAYPSEVTFSLLGHDDCSLYYSTTGASNQANTTVQYTLSPAHAGLYRLRLTDVGGDGLSGTIALSDAEGHQLFSRNGSDLRLWDCFLNISTDGEDEPIVGIDDQVGGMRYEVGVYPNPTTGVVNIDAEGVQRIELLDMSGRVVLHAPLSSLHSQIDLGALPAGIYMLRAVSDKGVAVKRIVKQ